LRQVSWSISEILPRPHSAQSHRAGQRRRAR